MRCFLIVVALWLLLIYWRMPTVEAFIPKVTISPVFIWGIKILHNVPLGVMSDLEFSNILSRFSEKYMFVAFAEDTLTTDDFKCMNNNTHKPCFLEMRRIKKYAYFPRVVNPLDTLRALMPSTSYSHYPQSVSQLRSELSCQPKTMHTVYFPKLKNASRATELAFHDNFIINMTESFLCPTIFFYLGENRSVYDISARKLEGGAESTNVTILKSDLFHIHFTELSARKDGVVEPIVISSLTSTREQFSDKTNVVMVIEGGQNLTFEVESNDGYYSIKRFHFNSKKYSAIWLEAPNKFSYYCGEVEMLSMEGDGATLHWENLQFELYEKAQKETHFSEAWHCSSIVSVGIASGLLVMTLICAIVFGGVCWIMDINACDRFEDPKGKPLIITVKD